MAKAVLFTSGKGGVGRKQILINAAYYARTLEKKVLIVNFDNNRQLGLPAANKEQLLCIQISDDVKLENVRNILRLSRDNSDFIFITGNIMSIFRSVEAVDAVLLITTPYKTSIESSLVSSNLIRNRFGDSIYSIINKAGECPDYEYSHKAIAKYLNTAILGVIPYDEEIIKAEQLDAFYVECAESSPAALATMRVTNKIISGDYPKTIFLEDLQSILNEG
ncbi:MAG: hypothetical protein ACFE7E_05635 [Candidatus Hodarchaeota archaeon]